MTLGMGDKLYSYTKARELVRQHLNKEQYESIAFTETGALKIWNPDSCDWDPHAKRLFAIADLILKVPPPQFPGSQPGYGDDEIAYLHYQSDDNDLYVFDRHVKPPKEVCFCRRDKKHYPAYGCLELLSGTIEPLISIHKFPHLLDGGMKYDETWEPKPYGDFRLGLRRNVPKRKESAMRSDSYKIIIDRSRARLAREKASPVGEMVCEFTCT